MRVIFPSTVDLLGTELAKARAALQEIHPNVAAIPSGENVTPGALAMHKKNLIGHHHDFLYGTRRLTLKELGLVVTHSGHHDRECLASKQHHQATTVPARPPCLLDIISNSLILDNIAPYLPISSLLSLASTSQALRSVIFGTPYVFRHLDLTRCQSVVPPQTTLVDYEFYAGALRNVFSRLEHMYILRDVRTLVLDGLSVPADLVADVVLSDRFKVEILSIRECHQMDERKLMQILQHAVRPDRPKGTPKVKGIYHFTPRHATHKPLRGRYLSSVREWWGSLLNRPKDAGPSGRSAGDQHSLSAPNGAPTGNIAELESLNEWYKPFGTVLSGSIEDGWAKTLEKCEGIIAFDAVLCHGSRHNAELSPSSNENEPRPNEGQLGPAIATIALGPQSCAGCHGSHEAPAIWGQSPEEQFPLLSPPPLHSSKVTAAKRPALIQGRAPMLIARCADCLVNRWCRRCNKWFCSVCLPHPQRLRNQPTPQATNAYGGNQIADSNEASHSILDWGVSRDCWDCGPTCASCKIECQRTCETCQGGYCIEHNDGCTSTRCDWCNVNSRHHLRGRH